MRNAARFSALIPPPLSQQAPQIGAEPPRPIHRLGLGIDGRARIVLLRLREDLLPHLLHALAQLGDATRVGLQMMNHLLAMQELRHDETQPPRQRVAVNAPEEMLLHQAGPSLQDRIDGLAISVLDGHRDQVGGPVRPRPARLDDGLHPDVDDAALERLHQVVQVIDLPFREDDEHLLAPFHRVDGVAFRLLVLAPSLHGEGAEALEPPAGTPEALVERLAVHHVEEPAAATAGKLQAGPHVGLVGVIGDEDGARTRGQAPQHLEVARLDPEPIAPGQVESVEDQGRPDDRTRRLGRPEGGCFRHDLHRPLPPDPSRFPRTREPLDHGEVPMRAAYFFLVSRRATGSARVNSTTSSPVTVLMSWCRLSDLRCR